MDVLPHGPLQLVFGDASEPDSLLVYQVTGSWRTAWGIFPRNMHVISYKRELSLVSAVRLSAEGLHALQGLGRVKHVIRLGRSHARDDAFYVSAYPGVEYWAPRDAPPVPGGAVPSCVLDEAALLPFPARVWQFKTLRTSEAVLVLPTLRLLVSAVAVQNVVDMEMHSPLAVVTSWWLGLRGPAAIGRGWMRANHHDMDDPKARPLVEDFERLLVEVPFANLLTARGSPIRDGTARTQLIASVANAARAGLLTGHAPPRRHPQGVVWLLVWVLDVYLIFTYLIARGSSVSN